MSTSACEFKWVLIIACKKIFFQIKIKVLFQKTVIQKGEDHTFFLKEEQIILKDNLDWKKKFLDEK